MLEGQVARVVIDPRERLVAPQTRRVERPERRAQNGHPELLPLLHRSALPGHRRRYFKPDKIRASL